MKASGGIERILIISIGLIYIVHALTQLEWLVWVLGGLVFIIMALLLPQLRGSTLYLTVFFLILGGGLLAYQNASLLVWFQSASINIAIVTLFIFAPLFGIPARLPKYVSALKHMYRVKVKGIGSFFIGSQLLTSILAVFLNVGSITVVYHLASIHPFSNSSRLLGNALNRGFSAAILCSPYFAGMAIVSSALDLAWARILPFMLGLAVLTFIVSFFMELVYMKDFAAKQKRVLEQVAMEQAQEQIAEQEAGSQFKVLWSLVIYLAAAVLIIIALEKLLPLSMVVLTCLSAALFPLLWSMVCRVLQSYKQGVREHVLRTLPSLKKEMTLFLAAGFFSGAIGEVRLGEYMIGGIDRIPLPLPVAFTVLTVLIIAFTSFIGLHPIILVTILATSINPTGVGISPEFFGVLLLGSWAISNPLSPAAAVNNLIAGLTKTDVLTVSARNYKFAAVLLVILPIYLFITNV